MKLHEARVLAMAIQKEMAASAAQADRASQLYNAHMAMYNVAVQSGDDVEAEKQRDNVHTTVDSLLDAMRDVQSRQRRLSQIAEQIEDV